MAESDVEALRLRTLAATKQWERVDYWRSELERLRGLLEAHQ